MIFGQVCRTSSNQPYHLDPRQLVASYLSHKKVESKNERKEDFVLSSRVFIDMAQTPVTDPAPPSQTHAQLRQRFQQVCAKYEEKKIQRTQVQSSR